MTLDENKQAKIKQLNEFTSRYTSAVFPELDLDNATNDATIRGRLASQQLQMRRDNVTAYLSHADLISQQILAATTQRELDGIDITAGFDTLPGGVNLTERQLLLMLRLAGMSREDYERMIGHAPKP